MIFFIGAFRGTRSVRRLSLDIATTLEARGTPLLRAARAYQLCLSCARTRGMIVVIGTFRRGAIVAPPVAPHHYHARGQGRAASGSLLFIVVTMPETKDTPLLRAARA